MRILTAEEAKLAKAGQPLTGQSQAGPQGADAPIQQTPAMAGNDTAPAEAPVESGKVGDFSDQWNAGVDFMKSGLMNALAMGTEDEGITRATRAYAKNKAEKSGRVRMAVESFGDISSPSDLLQYGTERFARSAPAMVPYVVNPMLGASITAASTTGSVYSQQEGENKNKGTAVATGLATAGLEKLGMGKLLGTPVSGGFVNAGKNIVKTMGVEGTTEAGQQVLENAGVGRDDLLQGTGEAFAAGAIVGGGMRTAVDIPKATLDAATGVRRTRRENSETGEDVVDPAFDEIIHEDFKAMGELDVVRKRLKTERDPTTRAALLNRKKELHGQSGASSIFTAMEAIKDEGGTVTAYGLDFPVHRGFSKNSQDLGPAYKMAGFNEKQVASSKRNWGLSRVGLQAHAGPTKTTKTPQTLQVENRVILAKIFKERSGRFHQFTNALDNVVTELDIELRAEGISPERKKAIVSERIKAVDARNQSNKVASAMVAEAQDRSLVLDAIAFKAEALDTYLLSSDLLSDSDFNPIREAQEFIYINQIGMTQDPQLHHGSKDDTLDTTALAARGYASTMSAGGADVVGMYGRLRDRNTRLKVAKATDAATAARTQAEAEGRRQATEEIASSTPPPPPTGPGEISSVSESIVESAQEMIADQGSVTDVADVGNVEAEQVARNELEEDTVSISSQAHEVASRAAGIDSQGMAEGRQASTYNKPEIKPEPTPELVEEVAPKEPTLGSDSQGMTNTVNVNDFAQEEIIDTTPQPDEVIIETRENTLVDTTDYKTLAKAKSASDFLSPEVLEEIVDNSQGLVSEMEATAIVDKVIEMHLVKRIQASDFDTTAEVPTEVKADLIKEEAVDIAEDIKSEIDFTLTKNIKVKELLRAKEVIEQAPVEQVTEKEKKQVVEEIYKSITAVRKSTDYQAIEEAVSTVEQVPELDVIVSPVSITRDADTSTRLTNMKSAKALNKPVPEFTELSKGIKDSELANGTLSEKAAPKAAPDYTLLSQGKTANEFNVVPAVDLKAEVESIFTEVSEGKVDNEFKDVAKPKDTSQYSLLTKKVTPAQMLSKAFDKQVQESSEGALDKENAESLVDTVIDFHMAQQISAKNLNVEEVTDVQQAEIFEEVKDVILADIKKEVKQAKKEFDRDLVKGIKAKDINKKIVVEEVIERLDPEITPENKAEVVEEIAKKVFDKDLMKGIKSKDLNKETPKEEPIKPEPQAKAPKEAFDKDLAKGIKAKDLNQEKAVEEVVDVKEAAEVKSEPEFTEASKGKFDKDLMRGTKAKDLNQDKKVEVVVKETKPKSTVRKPTAEDYASLIRNIKTEPDTSLADLVDNAPEQTAPVEEVLVEPIATEIDPITPEELETDAIKQVISQRADTFGMIPKVAIRAINDSVAAVEAKSLEAAGDVKVGSVDLESIGTLFAVQDELAVVKRKSLAIQHLVEKGGDVEHKDFTEYLEKIDAGQSEVAVRKQVTALAQRHKEEAAHVAKDLLDQLDEQGKVVEQIGNGQWSTLKKDAVDQGIDEATFEGVRKLYSDFGKDRVLQPQDYAKILTDLRKASKAVNDVKAVENQWTEFALASKALGVDSEVVAKMKREATHPSKGLSAITPSHRKEVEKLTKEVSTSDKAPVADTFSQETLTELGATYGLGGEFITTKLIKFVDKPISKVDYDKTLEAFEKESLRLSNEKTKETKAEAIKVAKKKAEDILEGQKAKLEKATAAQLLAESNANKYDPQVVKDMGTDLGLSDKQLKDIMDGFRDSNFVQAPLTKAEFVKAHKAFLSTQGVNLKAEEAAASQEIRDNETTRVATQAATNKRLLEQEAEGAMKAKHVEGVQQWKALEALGKKYGLDSEVVTLMKDTYTVNGTLGNMSAKEHRAAVTKLQGLVEAKRQTELKAVEATRLEKSKAEAIALTRETAANKETARVAASTAKTAAEAAQKLISQEQLNKAKFALKELAGEQQTANIELKAEIATKVAEQAAEAKLVLGAQQAKRDVVKGKQALELENLRKKNKDEATQKGIERKEAAAELAEVAKVNKEIAAKTALGDAYISQVNYLRATANKFEVPTETFEKLLSTTYGPMSLPLNRNAFTTFNNKLSGAKTTASPITVKDRESFDVVYKETSKIEHTINGKKLELEEVGVMSKLNDLIAMQDDFEQVNIEQVVKDASDTTAQAIMESFEGQLATANAKMIEHFNELATKLVKSGKGGQVAEDVSKITHEVKKINENIAYRKSQGFDKVVPGTNANGLFVREDVIKLQSVMGRGATTAYMGGLGANFRGQAFGIVKSSADQDMFYSVDSYKKALKDAEGPNGPDDKPPGGGGGKGVGALSSPTKAAPALKPEVVSFEAVQAEVLAQAVDPISNTEKVTKSVAEKKSARAPGITPASSPAPTGKKVDVVAMFAEIAAAEKATDMKAATDAKAASDAEATQRRADAVADDKKRAESLKAAAKRKPKKVSAAADAILDMANDLEVEAPAQKTGRALQLENLRKGVASQGISLPTLRKDLKRMAQDMYGKLPDEVLEPLIPHFKAAMAAENVIEATQGIANIENNLETLTEAYKQHALSQDLEKYGTTDNVTIGKIKRAVKKLLNKKELTDKEELDGINQLKQSNPGMFAAVRNNDVQRNQSKDEASATETVTAAPKKRTTKPKILEGAALSGTTEPAVTKKKKAVVKSAEKNTGPKAVTEEGRLFNQEEAEAARMKFAIYNTDTNEIVEWTRSELGTSRATKAFGNSNHASIDISQLPLEKIDKVKEAKSVPLSNLAKRLGKRESSNDYEAINEGGYLGKYQFGNLALQDLGYVKPKPKSNTQKEWLENPDAWTKQDGVYSQEAFINDKDVQEAAFVAWEKRLTSSLKSSGMIKDYNGRVIQGVKVTTEGMKAAAHLLGVNGLKKVLDSGDLTSGKDANGTTAAEYLQLRL